MVENVWILHTKMDILHSYNNGYSSFCNLTISKSLTKKLRSITLFFQALINFIHLTLCTDVRGILIIDAVFIHAVPDFEFDSFGDNTQDLRRAVITAITLVLHDFTAQR